MTVPIDVAVSREPWVYQCARGCRERKTVCVTHGDGIRGPAAEQTTRIVERDGSGRRNSPRVV